MLCKWEQNYAAFGSAGVSGKPYTVYLRNMRPLYLYTTWREAGTAEMEFSLQVAGDSEIVFKNRWLYSKAAVRIYEMKNSKGRVSYKIFACSEDFQDYLRKNRDKKATQAEPLFTAGRFVEYPDTEVRRLTSDEVENYLSERRQPD